MVFPNTSLSKNSNLVLNSSQFTIPLAKPIFDEDMKNAAIDALQNEKFVMGESVLKFEEEFAKYCGVKHAVSTSSGTFSLQFALQALGIGSNDHVVTTPFSFIATANSIYYAGAIAVFADIGKNTFNLNSAEANEKLTKNVKAILPVHLYGYPADLASMLEIAGDRFIVEDCCQAHGALYHGKKVGSIGSVGCFSFYPVKNMTVGGDGGMATTDDEEVANRIAKLRDCGRISHYEHDVMGLTARLNTVNAAIGRIQLKKLDGWNEKRRSIAKNYNELLKDIDDLEVPPLENNGIYHVYHQYVVRTNHRNQLKTYLEQKGIQTGIHYPIPIHLQPIYRQLYGYKEQDFPESEQTSKKVLSLPMFPDLTSDAVQKVSYEIHQYFEKKID